MPLPPYIASKRAADEQDKEDYQTVFAKHRGSVAAPTASLHFDEGLLDALIAKGVDITYVTLHVGAGTFLPSKSMMSQPIKCTKNGVKLPPRRRRNIGHEIRRGPCDPRGHNSAAIGGNRGA